MHNLSESNVKAFFKKLFSRFSIVALTIILLFALLCAATVGLIYAVYLLIAHFFPDAQVYINAAITALAWIAVFITALHAANRDMVPETKIPWIICIIALNIFGVMLYAVFSSHRPSVKARRLYASVYKSTHAREGRRVSEEELQEGMKHWAATFEALSTANPSAVVHDGTKTEYFPSGEAFFERYLEDLERAEKYIFLEYFIVERGAMWNAILEVLERKVHQGVEVRMLYDDIGCMGKIHLNYHKTLRKKGIQCVKFNPFVPVVTNVHNNRDHRKITVIDGRVAYTGGLNLADEYINARVRFGYWKDSAVRLEGEGVLNLLFMFHRLYSLQLKRTEDIAPFLPETVERFEGEGYVQPYGDGPFPLYDKHLGEDVYLNIIGSARKYVYITTPYLIIDYRMREALILAAKRGVDVRIVTPFIPDKKLAFALTRSNYMALIKGGVKIYEYAPGFIHAKNFLADDAVAVVGTINLDYRSFLFHFEDGVLMYKTKAVGQLKEDFDHTLAVSVPQTEEDAKRNVVWRWICEIAKLFAPLF